MNTTKPKSKFSRFLKNNAALLLIIFCVLAITAVVLAVTLTQTADPVDNPVVVDPNPDDNKPDIPEPVIPQKEKIYFASPVPASKITVQFSDGSEAAMFEQNVTLGLWQSHMGVDIAAEEGTNVAAMYDGTVIDVSYNAALGNMVTIDHGDNVVATYASLGEVAVNKGDAIKKGDIIGTVSVSAGNEFMDGAHLHLSVKKNNKYVNPAPYVNGTIFREVEKTAAQ